jgi:hypothetical protein
MVEERSGLEKGRGFGGLRYVDEVWWIWNDGKE